MAIAISHGTAADGTFSPTGAAAWNAAHSLSGLSATSGALLYSTDATTLAQDGTNLLYTTASGPRLQVGSGTGTSSGLILGYEGTSSGFSAMWWSGLTPSASNYAIRLSDGITSIGSGGSGPTVVIAPNNTTKITQTNTAGAGPAITAGTATTDIAALSVTRTNNNAAVATGVKFAFTDTTSAAGFLPFQVLGGASASTNLFSVDKNGQVRVPVGSQTAPSYAFAAGDGMYSGGSSDVRWAIGGAVAAVLNNSGGGALQATMLGVGLNGDAFISRVASNAISFNSTATASGGATSRTEINKAVTAFTDGVAKTVFTLTIPNAAHSASYLVRVTGSIGAGGAIGANEASATNCYVVTLTRTAGVNATAAISSAFGAAATNVAGATTVTCTAALAAVSGGVGASNTIDIQATITKGGGSSDNHTCVATASLLNANSTGVTIS